ARFQVPADLDPDLAHRHEAAAVRVLEALGRAGEARVDFFVTATGDLEHNEVNTIPGMTEHPQLPRKIAAAGSSHASLIGHPERGPRAQRGQHHAGHDGALTGAPDVRRSGVQLREPARRAGPGGRVTGPRNPALDLLRGLAVGLVLLRHALPAVFPGAGVVG